MMENIFVLDGKVVDRETEGSKEFAPLDVMKTVAFRVKPLKWKSDLVGSRSGFYHIFLGGTGHTLRFGDEVLADSNSLLQCQAIAQSHHERLTLSYLDLGAWKEK